MLALSINFFETNRRNGTLDAVLIDSVISSTGIELLLCPRQGADLSKCKAEHEKDALWSC